MKSVEGRSKTKKKQIEKLSISEKVFLKKKKRERFARQLGAQ